MRRFVLRLIVAMLAFIIGLSASTIEMPSPAYDVVLHCDSSNVRSHSESLSQQITEISLEREGCDGPCPVYSV
ncbi:MAG: hypothetical protein M3371_05655, partial [Acidobacteriota bacterium]|nr:hypothetical protein [Acidobacteriota bacterium]